MSPEEQPHRAAAQPVLRCSSRLGLVIIGAIVLLGLLAPWIAPHPWDTISMRTRFLPPSATYWFGTDEYGRDVLSRLLMGARLSLAMGIGATAGQPRHRRAARARSPAISAAGSTRSLMRGADVLMAMPPIMLGLLVLAVTPPALWKTALAVGFVYIPLIARLARSVTLVARQRGVHPGRAGARRKHVLHPVPRDPAERLAAADRRGEPARHLRDPARLGA